MKLCECGCGEPAPIATKTSTVQGYVKGEPMRFVNGHQMRGPLNGRWKGGIRESDGYVMVWSPDHPNVDSHSTVPEHRLIAERALGRVLSPRHPVHHVNEDRADNRPENLVICEDTAYHMLLHQRLRALRACGNPNWRMCRYCKEYDEPSRMYVRDIPEGHAQHRECEASYKRERYGKAVAA